MSIPEAVTTATVHHDAPISFGGEPGRVMARFTPSATLIWEDTGTPLAGFFDAVSPENGAPLEIELPHTDQPGFVDGSGNTLENWHYSVKIWFFKDGQNIGFPSRDFQISSGQSDVDLALIPWGEAVDPTVAPMAYVTSVNGQTGDIEIESLQGPEGPAGPEGPEGPEGPQGDPGPIVPLDSLTDVVAPSPSDGQALIWDAGTSKWVNATVSTASIELDSLTDVDAAAPGDGDALVWDSGTSKWVATGSFAATLDELTDVDTTGASSGKVLTHNGTSWIAGTASGGATPPTIRASSSNAGISQTASVVVPATAQVGDVLTIFVGSNLYVSATPSGWTSVSVTTGGWHNGAVFAKVCTVSDPGATVNISLIASGTEAWNAYCIAVAGTDGIASTVFARTEASAATLATAPMTGWTQKDLIVLFGTGRRANSTLTFPSPATQVIARPNTESNASAVYQTAPPPPGLASTAAVTYTATIPEGSATGMDAVAVRFVALGTQGGPQAALSAITDTVGPATTPSFKVWTNVPATAPGNLNLEPMVWLDSSGAGSHGRNTLRVTTGNNSSTPFEVGVWFSNFFYRRFAVGGNGSITRLSEMDYNFAIGNNNAQDLLSASWGTVFTIDRGLQWVKRVTSGNVWPSWNVQPIGFFGQPITQTANYTIDCRDTIIIGNGSSITFTLPDPTTSGLNGRTFNLINKHSTALTVVSAGSSKTIDGAASVSLAQYEGATYVTDGVAWFSTDKGASGGGHAVGADLIQTGSYDPTVTGPTTGSAPALNVTIPNTSSRTGPILRVGTAASGTQSGNPIGLRIDKQGTGSLISAGNSANAGITHFAVDANGFITRMDNKDNFIFGPTDNSPEGSTASAYGLYIQKGGGWSAGDRPGRLFHKAWHHSYSDGWVAVGGNTDFQTKTANYTMAVMDELIIGNGTSITITLPDPAQIIMGGRIYRVKNTNATDLTVVSAGTSKTIDGAASVTLSQWGKVTVVSDGTQWLTV